MTTPVNFRVKNGLTVSNGVTISAGNVVISNGQLVIGATEINATSISASADNAYTNAIAIAANASNLTSGTVAIARIPVADSVSNTSISHVPTANNVKTAFDAAVTANTNAANATFLSSGTVAFARLPSLFIGTTTIQSTNAAQAVSGITTLAAGNTTITGFANASVSVNSALLTVGTSFIANTLGAFHTGTVNAASHTVGTSFIANTTLLFSTANLQISTINATSFGATLISNTITAQLTIGNSSISATMNGSNFSGTANNALSLGGTLASGYQTTAGLSANVATLTSNNSTNFGGLSLASVQGQITGNAATAYTNSVSYTDGKILTANGAITGNAATAYTNATIFAANASNANNGTLAEARLPFRMNQDVRSSDSPTFVNMTLSGNLTVSGTRTFVNTTTLDVGDNIVTLNADLGAVSPTENAGIEIMRGTSANVQFIWDETNDRWSTNSQPLAISSLIAAGSASGITTLAAGNTTITGFANASVSVNSALLTVGTSFIANTLGAFHTGTINAASFTTTNFRANTAGVFPASNTVGNALGNTTARWDLSSTTGSFAGAVSGITTLAAGNTTITGFANVTSTIQGGAGLTIAGAASGITTLAAGNTTITGFANVSSTLQVAGITTLNANVAMANNTLSNAKLTSYKETVVANTITTNTHTIDLSLSNVFDLTLANAAIAISFTNPPATGTAYSFTIQCKQDATGSRVITWPASVKYPNASTPTMSTGANKIDIFSFFTLDGGTIYAGALSLANI